MELVTKNYIEYSFLIDLFLIDKSEKNIVKYQDEFRLIKESITSNIEMLEFLKQTQAKKSDKIQLIEKIFGKYLSKVILDFLVLLVENDKIIYILEIANSFIMIANKYLDVISGIIYSTFDLSEKEIKSIEDTISKKIGEKVQLQNIIDSTLIGGVKVVVANQVFDSSIKNKIDNLGTKALKK